MCHKNKKIKKFFIFIGVLAFSMFGFAENSSASITLPWSTTFNCSSVTYSYGDTITCDGLETISNKAFPGYINSEANYYSGGGGNGLKHNLYDGIWPNMDNSDSLGAEFATPQKELWFRFYIAYKTGFHWGSYEFDKWIYLYTSGYATNAIMESHGQDQCTVYAMQGSGYAATGNGGWQTYWAGGGINSNGSWHSVEFHIKMDTNSADGIAEYWIDGVQKASSTNVDFSGGSTDARNGWVLFEIHTNQADVLNAGGIGSPSPLYYDDFAVNNTGYIGPLYGGSDTTPPVSPSGLSVS